MSDGCFVASCPSRYCEYWGGWTRTNNIPINSRVVCQLTYAPSLALQTERPASCSGRPRNLEQRALARSPERGPIIRIIPAIEIGRAIQHEPKVSDEPGNGNRPIDARLAKTVTTDTGCRRPDTGDQRSDYYGRAFGSDPVSGLRSPASGIRLQSDRSATNGSTSVARRAGTKQASSPTPINTAATPPNTTGSRGCT